MHLQIWRLLLHFENLMEFIESIQCRYHDYVPHRLRHFVESNSTYRTMFSFANVKYLNKIIYICIFFFS